MAALPQFVGHFRSVAGSLTSHASGHAAW